MQIPKTPPNWTGLLAKRGDDISAALSDARYSDAVRDAEQRYRHWEKVRFVARESELDPEILWILVKASRTSRLQPTPFTSADGSPMRYLVPAGAQRELMRIDQQLGGLVVADNEQPLTESQRDRFIISALMDEAIASSQIEGAATTRRVAREMLRRDRRPRTIDERMIVNNYRAIGFIREHRSTPLTPEFVIELQRMLTDGTLKQPDQVGRLRREDEDVVVIDPFDEVLHDPPVASELPRRLEVMCAFANSPSTDDASFMHPVVRAILLHFVLAYDHPFCDGNGRTARALFYWSMLRSGYWLVEYLAISRIIRQGPSKYGRAFLYSETDEFDLTYFIVHQLDVIRRARAELQQHLRRKGREAADARRRFKDDPDLNDRQRALLLGLVREPDRSVTIESHQRSHGVVYATARSDLLRLVERGYLAQQRIGNRFEFSAGPLLEALEPRPPTGTAPPTNSAPPAPS